MGRGRVGALPLSEKRDVFVRLVGAGTSVSASKGRAFRSLDKLIVRQGGEHVLYGSTLALAAVITTWSTDTGTSLEQLLDDKIR